jgi:hypothetical protein
MQIHLPKGVTWVGYLALYQRMIVPMICFMEQIIILILEQNGEGWRQKILKAFLVPFIILKTIILDPNLNRTFPSCSVLRGSELSAITMHSR